MNIEIMNYWPILSKAFWKFCDLYKLSEDQIKALLGANNHEYEKYSRLKTLPANDYCCELVDTTLHIHKNLFMLFGQQKKVIYNYLHVPRKQFDNLTILEYVMRDNTKIIENLRQVKESLYKTYVNG